MTTVAQLYRYPLKSHGREELAHTTLTAGQSMPWDRTWAVVHDAAPTEPSGRIAPILAPDPKRQR